MLFTIFSLRHMAQVKPFKKIIIPVKLFCNNHCSIQQIYYTRILPKISFMNHPIIKPSTIVFCQKFTTVILSPFTETLRSQSQPWLVWLNGLMLAWEHKGHRFNSQSGHMPGFRARSPIRGAWESTTHWCFSPFLLSFPPLKINKIFKKNFF